MKILYSPQRMQINKLEFLLLSTNLQNDLNEKNMRVLITSGGTIVKIDDVRHIGNFSTGSFPAKIASAALAKGHEVIYLHSKNSKMPNASRKLKLIAYETYNEYAKELENILSKNKIDIVFLGAAVSDYGIKEYKGKISSSKPTLNIKLYRLPKIIKLVKLWSKVPLFQVGFKLLSNVTDKELIEVAYKSSLENRSDLTIANDLEKIKSGRREVILVTPERGAIKLEEPKLAEKIIDFAERRAQADHFKTVLKVNKKISDKFQKETQLFNKFCRSLSEKGLMTKFFIGAKAGHGSLALRTNNNSFLITARGSNKENIRSEDIVHVRKVDWKKREIFVESGNGKKASLNAVLVAAIFEKFPHINAVVHTHNFAKNALTTAFSYTPGTLEYAAEALNLFKKNIRIINLKNHGLAAIGKDLEETVKYVLG
jgi:ribulose-5-phosphate 4-epimerase/fuculose-1-phosphate aldolase